MAAPSMTFGAAGNVITSASLAAATPTTSGTQDWSAVFEAQLIVKVVMGGTVSTTAGVRIDVYPVYGTGPTASTTNPNYTYSIPAGAASATVWSPKIYLPTGKYQIKLTNLDATNAVTVEATADTVSGVA